MGREPEVRQAIQAGLSQSIDVEGLPIASPWSTSHLSKLVASDVFPGGTPPVNSRDFAMRLDGIGRASCRERVLRLV